MKLLSTVALLLAISCVCVSAVTQIVAFGDSLTDDCTHGTKQVIDAALNITAVSHAQAKSPLFQSLVAAAPGLRTAGHPWSAVLQRLYFQQWTHVCNSGSRTAKHLLD